MAESDEVPTNSVFIGGLATELTVAELTSHLASLSVTTDSLSIFEGTDGRSKGCAMATFATTDDAAAAISTIDGSAIAGKEISARADRGPGRSRRQPKNEDPTLVYVGNLSPDVTEESLTSIFAAYGHVVNVTVNRKRRGEQSRCWGTIQFASKDEADAALVANGTDLDGEALVVEELKSGPRPKKERKPRQPRAAAGGEDYEEKDEVPPPEGSLHIGNLAWTVSEEDLTKLFATYGEVVVTEIARDKRTDKSRGWGSIQMASSAEAEAALAGLNNIAFHERDIDVQIKKRVSGVRKAAGTREKRERKPRVRKPREDDGEERAPRERKPRVRKPRGEAGAGEEQEGGERRRRRRAPRDGEDGEERAPRAPRVRKEPEPIMVSNPECYLFVGNLAWDVSNEDLAELFSQAGNVTVATVTTSKRAREDRSRGWGTVEMASGDEAQAAINQFNEYEFKERNLIVRLDTRVVQE